MMTADPQDEEELTCFSINFNTTCWITAGSYTANTPRFTRNQKQPERPYMAGPPVCSLHIHGHMFVCQRQGRNQTD